MGSSEFSSTIRKIKKCPSAILNKIGKETFWTINFNELNILQNEFDEVVVVDSENEDGYIAPPKKFSENIPCLDELKLSPYPYQLTGISCLLANRVMLLADDMGLGKTPQFLITAYVLWRQGLIKHCLIISPSTIKYQIAEEIEKWFHTETEYEQGYFDYKVVDGTVKKRQKIYDEFLEHMPVITIVNYEMLNNDLEYFSNLGFDMLVCDEAHRLKNAKTISHKSVALLNIQRKYLVTGTPICKNPLDTFNLFKLLDPRILGSYQTFAKKHLIIGDKFNQQNAILSVRNYANFHNEISTYMLRRLKKDVLSSLPPLIITNRYIEMTNEQKNVHNQIMDALQYQMQKTIDSTITNDNNEIISQDRRSDSLMGYLVMAHCAANNPQLLYMSETKMALKFRQYVKQSNKPSPKMEECMDICKEYIDNNPNQKIVIFTQYERMQFLLYEYMKKKFNIVLVNGKQSAKKKMEEIHKFKQDPKVQILIGTNSMNYGINLQEASLCICLDQSWTPNIENQRYGRIHRANSTHDSMQVINLISLESIDEKILSTLQARQNESDRLIENSNRELTELEYIDNLLKNRVTFKKS